MRAQRTAGTLATELADRHASGPATGNVGRSRTKSRFSGSANAMLSQLKSIGGSRPPTRRGASAPVANRLPAPATVVAKEDPVADAVRWINHRRRQVDEPPVGVAKPTRARTATTAVVLTGRAPPAPPLDASGGAAQVQTNATEHAADHPVIDAHDDLFELPLAVAGRAPRKTLLQLFDEERAFQHASDLPAGMQAQDIAAARVDDDDLIEVDLRSGRIDVGASAAGSSGPAAPAMLKSTVRKPDAARRDSGRSVSWHPDVRDTTFASAQEKGGPRHRTTDPELFEILAKIRENQVLQEFGRLPVDRDDDEGKQVNQRVAGAPTPDRPAAHREQPGESASSPSSAATAATAAPAHRARRGGITRMLGRIVQLPRKLWR
ncbi:hypothetical protein [Burkholderia sp. 22313]|uniref:hypothetical protein n=1 Tax=Burkholderia sp. 22313 TaxID=3453908 RepID=UPI003F86D9CF